MAATAHPPRAPAGGDPLGAVFAALADPTRRAVVELLARGPATATELATQLPVSRQAVTKHLAALERAGLVDAARVERGVAYHLTPAGFTDVAGWMARVGADWDERLATLARHLAGRRTIAG